MELVLKFQLNDVWVFLGLKSDFFGKSGTHKFNKKELEEIKSNKVDLNYEAILDIHILLNARFIGHDGISRFPKMAENIGKVENAYFKF